MTETLASFLVISQIRLNFQGKKQSELILLLEIVSLSDMKIIILSKAETAPEITYYGRTFASLEPEITY